MMIPELDTPRLRLRAPRLEDAGRFAAFYGSDRSTFVGGPKTREEAWRQLATELGHWHLLGYGRWIVERLEDGAVIGNVGLWNPAGWPEPEIGWDLYAGFEGQGYATEAALAARAHAYATLGWDTVISLVDPANAASARVAARLGCWHDSDYDLPGHGPVQVWRHPSADAEGSVEAYA